MVTTSSIKYQNISGMALVSVCLVLKYGYRLNNKLSYIFKDHIWSFIT